MGIKLAELEKAIDEFNLKFPRPNIPPLEISDFVWVKDQSIQWPNTEKAGVYFLFNEHEELVYIGKTSCNSSIGLRLGAHFYTDGRPKDNWLKDVKYVKSIGLQAESSFEAPAIEEYLIQKLNPILNVSGRTK